jgi:hypothetical protein
VLIGGGAMQAFGLDRATKDVDFAVRLEEGAAVERSARAAGLQVRPLSIGGFSVERTEGRIDFIDRRHGPRALFEQAVDEAQRAGFTVLAEGTPVLTVPLEYLVALKMVGARPRDEADLDFLLRSHDLDYPAARAVVTRHLGEIVARYLDRTARQAGRQDAPRDYEDDS